MFCEISYETIHVIDSQEVACNETRAENSTRSISENRQRNSLQRALLRAKHAQQ